MGSPTSDALEIEVTLDVDSDTLLPDWRIVSPIVSVGGGEVRELDAVYFDTSALALGRAQYALRRRTGGPDAGWHLKGPRQGRGRRETGWPLGGGESGTIPVEVMDAVADLVDEPLAPIARIRNTRTAHALRDRDGLLIAEMVDDRVHTHDYRTGIERRWREWEIELGPAAPTDSETFFAGILDAAVAVGARPASTDSKLARALGL